MLDEVDGLLLPEVKRRLAANVMDGSCWGMTNKWEVKVEEQSWLPLEGREWRREVRRWGMAR